MDSPSTLVLAFGASAYADAPAPFAELAAAFPVRCWPVARRRARSPAPRCPTRASAWPWRASSAPPCSAMVEVNGPDDSRSAGAQLAAAAAGGAARRVRALRRFARERHRARRGGLAGGLPAGVAITGGLAGDGSRFASTWVLDGAQPQDRRICAVGLYGDHVRVSHGCEGGWSDFGPARRITRSQATCSTSSTVSRRSICTRPTSASARRRPAGHRTAVPAGDQATRRVRRGARAHDPRHRRSRAFDDLRRRHARKAPSRV